MDRLAELRERRALTLRELAEMSGVAADTINQIELGHRKARPSTLRKLAKTLGVEVREFFEEPTVPGKGEAPKAGPPREEGDPLAHPEAREWLREHENWRLYMPYEAWARDVAKMNVFDVREEWHRLVDEEDTLWRRNEIEELAKRIRHSGTTREEVLAAHNRASEIKSALRKDLRRRFMRRIVAAANFEVYLENEAIASMDEKIETLLRAPEDAHT